MSNVAVFGTGYVGCVSAACLSRDGHRVIGVDVDSEKVSAINRGQTPIAESGLEELIARQVKANMLAATDDAVAAVRETEIGFITVGTPSQSDGAVNTRAMEAVIKDIGTALRETKQDYTVVVRSTLLPGILEQRMAPLLADAAGRPLGPGLQLCNNPEFLREGSAIADYDDPPFVILGTMDGWEASSVMGLYDGINAEQIVTDSYTAALLKYSCNAFHALKVAFANEIGALAKSFGADGQQVMKLLCADKKLNISPAYLRPGFAFGGSCLPKDLRALTRHAQQEALRVNVLDATLASNEEHLRRAVNMIEQTGHRRLGLVGLSFKAGTDDLRESPQVLLAETLLGRGYDIKIFDPGVSVSRLRGGNLAYVDQRLPHLAALLVGDVGELFGHSDLLILATSVANGIGWQSDYHGDSIDLRQDLSRR